MSNTPRLLLTVLLALGVGACASGPGSTAAPATTAAPPEAAPSPTLVLAGAPGEDSREINASDVSIDDLPSWTEADAAFMSGMIHHHAQALQMTALIGDRSTNAGVHQMGLRMEISQRDEIRLMQRWLEERGQEVPQVILEKGPEQGNMPSMDDMGGMQHEMHGAHGDHGIGGMAMMPGMLSEQQMIDLRESEAKPSTASGWST